MRIVPLSMFLLQHARRGFGCFFFVYFPLFFPFSFFASWVSTDLTYYCDVIVCVFMWESSVEFVHWSLYERFSGVVCTSLVWIWICSDFIFFSSFFFLLFHTLCIFFCLSFDAAAPLALSSFFETRETLPYMQYSVG